MTTPEQLSAKAPGHLPVLLEEVLSYLVSPGRFLDCTFGGGGHSQAILQLHPMNHVLALDTDPETTLRGLAIQAIYGQRFELRDLNFRHLGQLAEQDFDGVLFDLGTSSFQLDQAQRGFSFNKEAMPDMRLNPREGISAREFLEKANEEDLVEAVRDFGEERHWKRVVHAILAARGKGILQNTLELAKLIQNTLRQPRHLRIHPATKTFQGIRIAVNQELDALQEALPMAFNKLKIGGILAVISFHSLEDRIVKRFFKKMAGLPEDRFDSRPQDSRSSYAELLTKKAIEPSEEEQKRNPRSRSAKLRVLRKLRPYTL